MIQLSLLVFLYLCTKVCIFSSSSLLSLFLFLFILSSFFLFPLPYYLSSSPFFSPPSFSFILPSSFFIVSFLYSFYFFTVLQHLLLFLVLHLLSFIFLFFLYFLSWCNICCWWFLDYGKSYEYLKESIRMRCLNINNYFCKTKITLQGRIQLFFKKLYLKDFFSF